MVFLESVVKIYKKVRLETPILIEGLPGTGFVANICAISLVDALRAKKMGEIMSPYFTSLATTETNGKIRTVRNELYYWKAPHGSHDLAILYGNAQAINTYGQYELCSKIISYLQEIDCRFVITVGGIKKDRVFSPPRLYITATDAETLNNLRKHGLNIIQGHLYGATGLLLGLAKLRGLRGCCISVETQGTRPDILAAKEVLKLLENIVGIKINHNKIEKAAKKLEPLII
ncbi:MAG: PAC2 family protein [Candidatus Bathyarchaeota archaeon]|nr:MAG: PAC2 family protein [Candidatus Bathyarchaeota archaeon]